MSAATILSTGFLVWRKKRRVAAAEPQALQQVPQADRSLHDYRSAFILLSLVGSTPALAWAACRAVMGEASFPHIVRFSLGASVTLLLPLSVYVRNAHVRKTLAKEARDWAARIMGL